MLKSLPKIQNPYSSSSSSAVQISLHATDVVVSLFPGGTYFQSY